MQSPKSAQHSNRTAGFTLIEIIIVIAIIGLLTSAIVGGLGGTLDDAKKKTAKLFVTSAVKLPLTRYKIDMGNYPSTAEGLSALLKPPGDKAGKWGGPYLDQNTALEDPWGNLYQYRFPGRKNTEDYDVWSFGPDGKESEDDIGNW